MLPAGWVFEFVDGEQECLPADGVEEIYPAPYFCYYDVPTFENVQAAHALIHEILEEEGPFDAVMGFSQCVYDTRYCGQNTDAAFKRRRTRSFGHSSPSGGKSIFATTLPFRRILQRQPALLQDKRTWR